MLSASRFLKDAVHPTHPRNPTRESAVARLSHKPRILSTNYCKTQITKRGWTLAPAYDINPTNSEYQSILITASSNKADLNLLNDAAEDYMIKRSDAESIINEVVEAVKSWKDLAKSLRIPEREMALFSGRLP